ncbi:hypothetical protein T265_15595, partial [Opisthorchis viverrini]
ANVYHAYHILRASKIPAENITTIAYDDIANNLKNPFKGKVFHDYEHKDVYKGVVIDYRGKDVKPYIFTNVLKDDKKLEKRGESYGNANVYHAYHILRASKIPAENITTIAYDDIANNLKNPFKGKVFHDYEDKDVYKCVVIDYRGK